MKNVTSKTLVVGCALVAVCLLLCLLVKALGESRRVHVELPDLKYFAEGKAGILLRHLKASPEWQVCRDGADMVAYRRQKTAEGFTSSMNGYLNNLDEAAGASDRWQVRFMFRFSKAAGGPFERLGYLTKVDPMNGDVELSLKRSDQGIESCIAVGQGQLWFEFFEQSQAEPRVHTRQAIKWLAAFLADLRKFEDEISTNGYAAKLMPPGVPKEGKPTIEVQDGFQAGIYNVVAWVNPGADGETYLKVFDAKSGSRLSEDRVTPKSIEYIGWSPNADKLFFYNCEVTIYEGDWEHTYDARFELWFRNGTTGKESKLIETKRSIHGWER